MDFFLITEMYTCNKSFYRDQTEVYYRFEHIFSEKYFFVNAILRHKGLFLIIYLFAINAVLQYWSKQ